MRVGGEIDAEEEHDQARAEQPDNGESDRRRPGGDAPGAQEFAEHVNEVDILEKIGLIGEGRDLLGQGGGARCDPAGKLSDLLGQRRSRRPEHQNEEQRDGQHDDGEHQQPRQLGEIGQRPARAIEHDGQQDSGKGQQHRGARIPETDRKGDDADGSSGHLCRRGHVARLGRLRCFHAGPWRVAQDWLGHGNLA
jgi:hypothetical protein